MRAGLAALALAAATAPLAAQGAWNDSTTRALVARAIAQRQRTIADSQLQDFRARANGFVFFLGQLGEGLADPPQLIKSDQLALEIFWKAPNLAKQRIVGWRDRRDLPTDIQYHQDHLGIVLNNFADAIRLGEGDEVRDVPHPLAPAGPTLYDYVLVDSIAVVLPDRTVRVLEVRVRPRSFDAPRLIGSLFLDAEQAELVRMSFSFTPASYLDRQLEDISIVLDHALWDGRYWLPYRQEIEIRRRATWLDLPARGIIRGRWEIGEYEFNLGLASSFFRGPEIVAAPRAVRDTFPWTASLDSSITAAVAPVERRDLSELRLLAADLVERYTVTGLPPLRVGATRLSELARANRVEGVALGAGIVARPWAGRLEVRLVGSYGLSDQRPKGSASIRGRAGAFLWEVRGHRQLKDVADDPPVSTIVNSIASQEFASDAGDYYLQTGAAIGLRRSIGARWQFELQLGGDEVHSVVVGATPLSGAFRPNPALGLGPTWWHAMVRAERTLGTAGGLGWAGHVAIEAGAGHVGYWRLAGQAKGNLPTGTGTLVATAALGIGSLGLPAHRTFVLGGRGTLLGEPFRAFGGRVASRVALEWRLPVPGVGFGLGTFGAVRPAVVAIPFVAAGWADEPVPGTPWGASGGVRPVAGLGLEVLRLVRVDLGVSLRSGSVAGSFDLARALWDIL